MVACLVRDQEVVGSNPVTPTKAASFYETCRFYLYLFIFKIHIGYTNSRQGIFKCSACLINNFKQKKLYLINITIIKNYISQFSSS